MRNLIILRGIPGSGKSTWLKNQNLTQYTICPDDIRLMFSAPILNENNKLSINQANDKKVWALVYELLEQRMDKGELTIIDATHKTQKDLNRYAELANKYLYDMLIVDFSSVSLDTCLAQNMQRPEYKQVPDEVIRKHHTLIKNAQLSKNFTIITHTEIDKFNQWLNRSTKQEDMTHYKKIHILGDIQGCVEPLKEYFKDGLNSDELYIFVGDFLDRGIQNGEVLKWAINNLTHTKNAIILMGNHELHLRNYIADLPCKNQGFLNDTLPQLLEAGITKGQIFSLLRKMKDIFFFSYKGQNCVVTHAGLNAIPEFPELVPSFQYWKGVNGYGEKIDELFAQNNPDWVQFHGHRNLHSLPVRASENSFSLESKVEFGEYFSIVTLE